MSYISKGGPPPWLVRFFHRFPHINVTGNRVNSTFDWRNEVYLESLGILASLPALLLIFFLLMLLLYLLTRCCDRNAKRDRPLLCLKVLLSLLGLLCCAAIGLGLYGNDDFHNGIEMFVASLRKIQLHFVHISNQTYEAQNSIEARVFPYMSQLGVVFERPLANHTVHVELLTQMQYMEQNMTHTAETAKALRQYFKGPMNVSPHNIVQLIETIRWPTTLGLLIIFIIFCVVLFYAIVRHSRCCFITFSVLGLLAVILNWSLVSLYLVGAVGLADICIDPNRAAITELTQASISLEVSDYYLNCRQLRTEQHPFRELVLDAQQSLEGAQHTLRVINSIANNYYRPEDVEIIVDGLFKELYNVEGYLTVTSGRPECKPVQEQWIRGVDAVCGTGLIGLALLLLSALISALLFTLLVGFDSHTWIYIQRRKRYLQQEECVSFLPTNYDGGPSGTGTMTGSTGRGGRRSGGAGSNSPYNLVAHWDTQPTPLGRNGVGPSGGSYRGQGTMGHSFAGPNNGQYATLSKQCKTLESNDFY